MNYVIRKYENSDYETLKSWWTQVDEQAPTAGAIPTSSSFILELDNKPAISLSVCLTNTDVAYLNNFIGNPEVKGSERKKCGNILFEYAEKFSKVLGYNKLFCFVKNDKLVERYKHFGLTVENSNIKVMSKEIF